jgi:hypothetical protein
MHHRQNHNYLFISSNLTRLPSSIAPYKSIPLTLLQSKFGARKNLDTIAFRLCFSLAGGFVAGSDGDVDSVNVKLLVVSNNCG